VKEKIVALLTDKQFWRASLRWTGGIAAAFVFVMGAGTVIVAFIESPWEWISIMAIIPVSSLLLGAVSMLQHAPMEDAEFAKRLSPFPGATWNGEEWVHSEA